MQEIAIINCNGNLKYEAFTQEDPENHAVKLNKKSLREILTDINNSVVIPLPLELKIAKAILIVSNQLKDYWLVKILLGEELYT